MQARIVQSTPLFYRDGADALLDRPSHVRAGSSLARVGERIAVVQDDANFLALIDEHDARAQAIALPPGEGGLRQFDDSRGNKAWKLDLEACVSICAPDHTLLLCFGSGSTSRRESVLVARFPLHSDRPHGEPIITLHPAPALYAALRDERAFAGSEMNIEGAVFMGDRVRLFNRGNGMARDGLLPVNACCDLDWPLLQAHLLADGPSPSPHNITPFDLGALDGIGLSFTDAALSPDGKRLLFSAAAEDNPDATRDGPVAGSVLGLIEAGRAHWTRLLSPDGTPSRFKIEGVLWTQPDRALAVVDRDRPSAPSELCVVELTGF